MNKRGQFFGIFPKELIMAGLNIVFVIGVWMVAWGVREKIIEVFNFTQVGSIVFGIILVLGVLAIVKYSPFKLGI